MTPKMSDALRLKRNSKGQRIDTFEHGCLILDRPYGGVVREPVRSVVHSDNIVPKPSDVGRRSGFDQDGVALAAAGADRGEAETAAVAAQLVDHRAEDSPARGADRVPERDRAAVHVRL